VLTPFQADFDSQDHEAALELIKTQADIIPTVYISSTESFDSRLEAIRGGGQAFFTYPVDIGELIGTLDDFTLPRKNIPFRVLILDHDVETASYYALNLEKVGMETRIITQPLYLLHPLNDFNPDLIMMSFDFPDCNGLELAVIIRQMEIFVSVPILFVTTSMDHSTGHTHFNGHIQNRTLPRAALSSEFGWPDRTVESHRTERNPKKRNH
jgi:PleD family two-component response regulator